MPDDYTPVSTLHDHITLPAELEPATAESVRVPLQELADIAKWLEDHLTDPGGLVALLANANNFTNAPQTVDTADARLALLQTTKTPGDHPGVGGVNKWKLLIDAPLGDRYIGIFAGAAPSTLGAFIITTNVDWIPGPVSGVPVQKWHQSDGTKPSSALIVTDSGVRVSKVNSGTSTDWADWPIAGDFEAGGHALFGSLGVSALITAQNINASAAIEALSGHVTAGANVEAGVDVTAGQDVTAVRDVTAGQDATAVRDVTAGRGVTAGPAGSVTPAAGDVVLSGDVKYADPIVRGPMPFNIADAQSRSLLPIGMTHTSDLSAITHPSGSADEVQWPIHLPAGAITGHIRLLVKAVDLTIVARVVKRSAGNWTTASIADVPTDGLSDELASNSPTTAGYTFFDVLCGGHVIDPAAEYFLRIDLGTSLSNEVFAARMTTWTDPGPRNF